MTLANNFRWVKIRNILESRGVPIENGYFSCYLVNVSGKLKRLDELVAKKRQIFGWYEARLSTLEQLRLNPTISGVWNSYWMVTAILDPLLIFGLGLGVYGAAWATIARPIVPVAPGPDRTARICHPGRRVRGESRTEP